MDRDQIASAAERQFSEIRALQVCFKVPHVAKSAIVFYTSLLMRLEPKQRWDIDTAATDGQFYFYNPLWWIGLQRDECYTINAHEVLHVAFKHHLRRGNREPELWNIGCDLAINGLLVEAGFHMPDQAVLPGKGKFAQYPKGLAAESYYDLLHKEKYPPPPPPPAPPKQKEEDEEKEDQGEEEDNTSGGDDDAATKPEELGQEEGQGTSPGAGDDEGTPESSEEGKEDDAEAGDGDRDADGEGEAGGDGADPGDSPADGSGDGATAGHQSACPDPGGCGGVVDPQTDEAGLAEQDAKWDVAVAQAARMATSIGTLPGGLERIVGEMLHPKADWRQVLREFVSARSKSDFNRSRPNRRYLQQGAYLPSLDSDSLGDVVITIDCSGSISQADLDVFASEVSAIVETFDCRLTLVYHDIPVTHVENWQPSDGPLVMKCHGGGGTSHIPAFDYIEANAPTEAPVVICFTDLYTTFPSKAPSLPVLWAVYGQQYPWSRRPEPPFGQVVEIPFGGQQ